MAIQQVYASEHKEVGYKKNRRNYSSNKISAVFGQLANNSFLGQQLFKVLFNEQYTNVEVESELQKTTAKNNGVIDFVQRRMNRSEDKLFELHLWFAMEQIYGSRVNFYD